MGLSKWIFDMIDCNGSYNVRAQSRISLQIFDLRHLDYYVENASQNQAASQLYYTSTREYPEYNYWLSFSVLDPGCSHIGTSTVPKYEVPGTKKTLQMIMISNLGSLCKQWEELGASIERSRELRYHMGKHIGQT